MTGTEVKPEAEPFLPDEVYEAELRELAAQYPAPTWDDLKPDIKYLYESREINTFDPDNKYNNVNVAIYGGRVVGTDPHYMRLRIRLSRELGVHPERILIVAPPEAWMNGPVMDEPVTDGPL